MCGALQATSPSPADIVQLRRIAVHVRRRGMPLIFNSTGGNPDMSASLKVAMVTGAGTGIGQAVSLALLNAGYAVVLAGRRQELLEATARQAPAGSKILVVPTDVSDPAAVKALFARTQENFGRLDVLFNNAGIGAPAVPPDELPYEKWKAVVDINLNGAFLCTQEAFRMMRHQTPRGGRIINNGSISAYAPRPLSIAYTATKHAISGLTKSTALDGRAFDIACGQIDIGNAATPLTEHTKVGTLQANGSMAPEPQMDTKHVGEAVVYMAGLPLHTNVLFMTVMATNMPFVGRG
jgi:NAD(P)-dependent dehydrogenase (short-subunit alcohol dehydrogenase family)